MSGAIRSHTGNDVQLPQGLAAWGLVALAWLVPLSLIAWLTSCTPQQLDTAEAACADAMPLAPLAGPLAPWIVAGCSAVALDAYAHSPDHALWVRSLAAQVKGGTP